MVTIASRLVDNPVRLARLSLHKTIAEAAELANVDWQFWYLTECGCYERISESIVTFLNRNFITGELQESYSEYRKRRQQCFGQDFPTLHTLPLVNSSVSPIESLWEALGIPRTAFAKSLCIQPAHLYRLKKGMCKELPKAVVEALRQAGMSEDNIDELNERQTDFYEG